MVDPTLLLIVAIAALVVGAFLLARHLDKKRTEAMRAFADERGWAFTNKDKHDRPKRYKGLEPFGKGSDRYARWIFSGEREGRAFELFTYHYAVHRQSGKNSHTEHYWFKVCTLAMPVDAPRLTIKDETIGHKLWDAIGGEDIDFESDAFSRRYWVKCEDRKFAYDVIDARMMEFLLEQKGWVWQWRGRALVLVGDGKLDTDHCDGLLSLAEAFAQRVPRHVVRAGARA